MAQLTPVDLDQLIPSLDMIHGLVDQDPSGAKAWLRDLMLMLRFPIQGETMPGVTLQEPEDVQDPALARDDPLRSHPVIGRRPHYDNPDRTPFIPNTRPQRFRGKSKAKKPRPKPEPMRREGAERPKGKDCSKTTLPIGKLKGMTLAEVVQRGDRQYLEWFERQPWTPPWLKGDIRTFLSSCSGNGSRAKLLA